MDGYVLDSFFLLLLVFSLTEMKNTQVNSHFIPLLFILIYLLAFNEMDIKGCISQYE